MYYVYILHSKKDGNLYIGSTSNLKSRLIAHDNGHVISTKNRRLLTLIYYESYINQCDAKRRELFLKGGNGRSQLKIQLQNSFKIIKYKHK
jgi:putative endonuclease